MPFIDERGRLFGKLNLIDAAAVLLVLVLIPIGYAAYRLFKTPSPTIEVVEPSTLVQGKNLSVQVQGRNLLPFLRAFVGPNAAVFLIQNPESGEVKLPDDTPPGTYDLTLYNEAQLVAKQGGAITIVPPAAPESAREAPKVKPITVTMMRIHGTFLGISRTAVKGLTPGYEFKIGNGAYVQIHSVKPPIDDFTDLRPPSQDVLFVPIPGKYRLRAVLRFRCAVVQKQCRAGNMVFEPGAFHSLPGPDGDVNLVLGDLSPDVDAARPVLTIANARVRFLVSPEVFSLVKKGDYSATWQAVLTTVEKAQDAVTQVSLNQVGGRGGVATVTGTYAVEDRLKSFEGVVRLAVRDAGLGWVPVNVPNPPPLDGVPLVKAGSIFMFDTSRYIIRGWILDIAVDHADAKVATAGAASQ